MKNILTLLLFTLFVCVDGYGQMSSSIVSESDTTIIGKNNNYGKTTVTRYFFKIENYNKAFKFVTLSNIPYMGLNDSAQKEFNELVIYITRMETISTKRKTNTKQ